MCGIFGYASVHRDKTVSVRTIRKLAEGVVSRGPHAWGVAWITQEGRISMYKQPGRITDYLDTLSACVDGAIMVIGHCRWATHGHPSDNSTNHPHPLDGGWMIHNGQIEQAEEFAEDFQLRPVTECDSELVAMLANYERGPRWHRLGTALEYAQGYAINRPAHAAAWLSARAPNLILARAGKPIYGATHTRGVYWSTTGEGIRRARMVPDNCAMTFSFQNGKQRIAIDQLRTQKVTDGNLAY